MDFTPFMLTADAKHYFFAVNHPSGEPMVDQVLVRLSSEQSRPLMAVTFNQKNITAGSQRVLIVENESLLGAALEHLLTGIAEFQVVGIKAPDEETLIEAIKHIQADVLIFDEVSLLKVSLRFLTKILNYPYLRIVVVNANNDYVQVYYKQEVAISQAADLINLIRGSKQDG
jgi:hypothetical protein